MGSAMTPSTPELEHVSTGEKLRSPGALATQLGRHPVTELGLRVDPTHGTEEDLERWLLASCCFGGRASNARALASARALETVAATKPASVLRIGAESLTQALEGAGHPQPQAVAGLIARLASALVERGPDALDAIGRGAGGLEELGSRLSALAPGFGAARVTRFLQPLRDTWSAASELPVDRNACRAAFHLGWLGEDDDDPSRLRSRLESEPSPPSLADFEFALAELGRQACRREQTERCPLGDHCPQRASNPEPRF